jgi:DNA-binding beta-propeller fold protein YncE
MTVYKRFFYLKLLIILAYFLIPARSVYALNIIKTKPLFEMTGSPNKRFDQPTSVAVGKYGRIYVMDGVNNRVVYFNKSGKFLKEFGSQGSVEGRFFFPIGIRTDRDGNVYVADSKNGRIQVFDADGNFLRIFSLEKTKEGFLADPTDIVINDDLDRCYIVDNDNHRILIYTKSGKYIKKFGSMGFLTADFFRYPYRIDIDSNNNYYVLEVINTRVQLFDENDNFKYEIAEWGLDKGQFFRPQGLAIDSKDRVFICDNYTGVIQVLSTENEFLGVIGDEAGEILRLDTPSGMYVDENNHLFVVQMLKHKVSVFQLQW